MKSNRRTWIVVLSFSVAVIVALAVVGRLSRHYESPAAARHAGTVGCNSVATAFHSRISGNWLTISAIVERILPDSHGTSTHQRFILRCPSGQTILVDNNVDVGQRAPVRRGENAIVRGQYIWNDLGGLIHDTHHSTDMNPNGWIYWDGRIYE